MKHNLSFYEKFPLRGCSERLEMTTMAIFYALLSLIGFHLYVRIFIAVLCAMHCIWAAYSWRAYFMLKKNGYNLNEPLLFAPDVPAVRKWIFLFSIIILFPLIVLPDIAVNIIRDGLNNTFYLAYVICLTACSSVMIEMVTLFGTKNSWSMGRYFILLLSITLGCILFFTWINFNSGLRTT